MPSSTITTTAGQIAVNAALPRELRNYSRVLNKDGMTDLLQKLGELGSETYRESTHKLNQLGAMLAYRSGGYSVGVEDLRQSPSAREALGKLRQTLGGLLADRNLKGKALSDAIVSAIAPYQASLPDSVYRESLAARNPLAMQVASGARGNKSSIMSLLGSDLLFEDQHHRVIPLPVLHSYSQGLTPAEHMAGTFGARQGVIATKMSVADAGYGAKKLNQAAHRLVVTAVDEDDQDTDEAAGPPLERDPDEGPRGLPVAVDDPGNVGALLAAPAGPYGRNTHLTPKVLGHLRSLGVQDLLVRSPMVGGPADGGVFARDLGFREYGRIPRVGESVGMTAAQAVAEKLTQAQLSQKHSGGVAGVGMSGFGYITQLIEIPKHFPGGATAATKDGRVEAIKEAPAGGYMVRVGGEDHYVPADRKVTVKVGDEVEAGDMVSDGIGNPDDIDRYKGVGEGRRYFMKTFAQALKNSGIPVDRRVVEMLSRGIIDHVKLTEEVGDNVPGDIVPYSSIEASYRPRPDATAGAPDAATGRYLEKPVLHYTIGTVVRPSVQRELAKFGVKKIYTHSEPPPFVSRMVRATDNLQHDADWMTKMYGSSLERGFLKSVSRSAVSDEAGTSFVPGLARSVEFGEYGKSRPPAPERPFMPLAPPAIDTQVGGPGQGGIATLPAPTIKKANGPFSAIGDLTGGPGHDVEQFSTDFNKELDPVVPPSPAVSPTQSPMASWAKGLMEPVHNQTLGQSAAYAAGTTALSQGASRGGSWLAGKLPWNAAKNLGRAGGGFGAGVGIGTGIELGMATPGALRNLWAASQGQDFDPGVAGKYEEYANNAMQGNPIGSALGGINNIPAAGYAAAKMIDIRNDANEQMWRAGRQDKQVAGLNVSRGALPESPFERDTKGMGVGDRFSYDLAHSNLAVPGLEPFRVPGTSIRVPAFASGANMMPTTSGLLGLWRDYWGK